MKQLKLTEQSYESLKAIEASFQELPSLESAPLNQKSTLLLHIDIVEGFLNFGALHSPRVAEIIDDVVSLNKKLTNVTKAFVLDEHPEDAEEFKAYPSHCVIGTGESDLVQELVPFAKDRRLFKKNSTNIFHAPEFLVFLNEHNFDTIILVGDVTDICILQAGLSIKTYFHEHQLPVRMILPINCVDTYQLDVANHDADLMNLFTLYNLQMNGIEIVQNIN